MKKKIKKTPKISKKAAAPKSARADSRGGRKIIPLGDKVLVRPASLDEKTTPGGIIIPDTIDKERPERGTVIAVGEGKWRDGKRVPLSVKEGDTVVFSKYGYDELKLDGEDFFVIKEENILAIIKN